MSPREGLNEASAFDDYAFDEGAFDAVAGPLEVAGEPAATPPPQAPMAETAGGIAYITVTDAAGRVLFRRAATASEVQDALCSADQATTEGEAAMDRIAYERLMAEISSPVIPSFIDPEFPFAEGDAP